MESVKASSWNPFQYVENTELFDYYLVGDEMLYVCVCNNPSFIPWGNIRMFKLR